MDHVMLFRYFKTLKEIIVSSQTNATSIPHSPDNLSASTEQERNAAIEADQTAKARDSAMAPVTALTNPPLNQSRARPEPFTRPGSEYKKKHQQKVSRGTHDHRE
jgi:hypothetical protein